MRIFVISLPRSLDRREQAAQKLRSKNIEFEFLDGIDGRSDEHPYLKNYNEKAFLLHRRRKAAPGELGCYVSHLLAWEKCVALNEAIVVLEDDFELTGDFNEGLKFVEQCLDRAVFVRLEKLKKNYFVESSFKSEKFRLVKQLKVGMCTTAYAVSPQGAKMLINHGREICAPIDLYIRHTLKHKQMIYALVPHIVYPTHADSIIGFEIRTRKEKGLFLGTRRFFHKWLYAIGDIVINLYNACAKY